MNPNTHNTRFDQDGLLFSEQFGDHYFSRDDGMAECRHVFLSGNDLPDRWNDKAKFNIGELGFGTGLNFLTTWHVWCQTRQPDQHLCFTSVEAYPLDVDTVRRSLGTWPQLDSAADHLIANWNDLASPTHLDEQTTLQVHPFNVEQALPQFPKIDAWYLDGFAPSRNPDMWSQDVSNLVASRTSAMGTLASYTAAGWVRRNLEAAGFEMEKRPGFGSKRDMIAGTLR